MRTTPLDRDVITLEGDASRSARARWHGADAACGSLLLFLDVDCVPAPDLAGEVRVALSRRHGLVLVDVRDPTSPAAIDQRRATSHESVPPSAFRPTAFAARRAVLDDLRRAVDAAPEDLGEGLGHAAARVGMPIWRWPTAIVHRQSTTRQRAHT